MRYLDGYHAYLRNSMLKFLEKEESCLYMEKWTLTILTILFILQTGMVVPTVITRSSLCCLINFAGLQLPNRNSMGLFHTSFLEALSKLWVVGFFFRSALHPHLGFFDGGGGGGSKTWSLWKNFVIHDLKVILNFSLGGSSPCQRQAKNIYLLLSESGWESDMINHWKIAFLSLSQDWIAANLVHWDSEPLNGKRGWCLVWDCNQVQPMWTRSCIILMTKTLGHRHLKLGT